MQEIKRRVCTYVLCVVYVSAKLLQSITHELYLIPQALYLHSEGGALV